jgi:hypothetical protein
MNSIQLRPIINQYLDQLFSDLVSQEAELIRTNYFSRLVLGDLKTNHKITEVKQQNTSLHHSSVFVFTDSDFFRMKEVMGFLLES